MSIKPGPTLTLLLECGPDDGLSIIATAIDRPEQPEELVSGVDPLGGRYLRHPEPANRRTWTYRWVVSSAPGLEP